MKKPLSHPMKTNISLACATFLLLPTLRAEQIKYPPINPALLYWQAAAQLPKFSDEQVTEINEIAAGKRPADPAKIESLGLRSAEGLLRNAAASSAPCDWGLVREDGPEMKMPHLYKMKQMANIAVVLGEARLADGKTAEGLEWLLSAHRIARHSGAGETLISYLVQIAIESGALQAAARHCLGWDETTRRDYARKLKELPPLRSLEEGYRGELTFVNWFERLGQLSESERAEKIRVLFAGGADEKYSQELRSLVNAENLSKEVALLREFHRRISTAFAKPWTEAETEVAAIAEAVQRSGSVLLKAIFPSLGPILHKGPELATRQTMLDLALRRGVRIDEADAAATHDAFGGQPLRLKKAADGALSLVAAEQSPNAKIIELKLGR